MVKYNQEVVMNSLALTDEIVRIAIKYFNMNEAEALAALNKAKAKKDFKANYLYSVLISAEPYFNKYLELTPADLQRKIGRVAFENLNYTALSTNETPTETTLRLGEFFKVTSDYGINPYKIFYSSVISKAHLFYNKEGYYSNYKQKIGNFLAVANAIAEQLGVDRAKVAKMYERCSTLAYKVDTEKVYKNYHAIRRLGYYGEIILNSVDVKEILRNNPTLYSCSENQIESAYLYLIKKAEIYSARMKDKRQIKDILANWIKNNSSVLAINVDGMKNKERGLYNFLITIADRKEVQDILYSIFDNPTSISAINKISSDTFFKNDNYMKVIKTLICFLDEGNEKNIPSNTLSYLKKSKLVYSIDYRRLYSFLDKIKNDDEAETLLQKFIEKGDAVFSYFDRNSDEEIIEKLRTNKIFYRIKLYNMTKAQIAQKFYEVFSSNPDERFSELNSILNENYNLDLICSHLNRAEKGLFDLEKVIKKNINILPLVKEIKSDVFDFLGTYLEYEERYLNTSFAESMDRFSSRVESVKKEIDVLYNAGAIEAKKQYDNVDALYNAFKKNTDEKLLNDNNPIRKRKAFSSHLNTIIQELENGQETRQLSIFDFKEQSDDSEALIILKEIQKRFNFMDRLDERLEKEK